MVECRDYWLGKSYIGRFNDGHLDWYARLGRHKHDASCECSALIRWLSIDGIASW